MKKSDASAPYDAEVHSASSEGPAHRRRRTRGRRVRASITVREIRAENKARELVRGEIEEIDRPIVRADCADVPRPCPYVGCRHHMYLDINSETGSIKMNFPNHEPWELPALQSCSIDIAEQGGITLEEIGENMNLTRERVRQIEVRGLLKLKSQERKLR